MLAQTLSRLRSPWQSACLLTWCRNMSRRDKLYGSEEGHAEKNEVRKEKWIRKQKRRTLGRKWREGHGFYVDPLNSGPIADMADWTHAASELPGPKTFKQKSHTESMEQLVTQVYKAALMVQRAKAGGNQPPASG